MASTRQHEQMSIFGSVVGSQLGLKTLKNVEAQSITSLWVRQLQVCCTSWKSWKRHLDDVIVDENDGRSQRRLKWRCHGLDPDNLGNNIL